MCQKPEELKQFESWYYNAPQKDRLAGYARFRKQYPQYDSLVLQNPFIKMEFHHWYDTLGYEELSKLGFRYGKGLQYGMRARDDKGCLQADIQGGCFILQAGGKGNAPEDI